MIMSYAQNTYSTGSSGSSPGGVSPGGGTRDSCGSENGRDSYSSGGGYGERDSYSPSGGGGGPRGSSFGNGGGGGGGFGVGGFSESQQGKGGGYDGLGAREQRRNRDPYLHSHRDPYPPPSEPACASPRPSAAGAEKGSPVGGGGGPSCPGAAEDGWRMMPQLFDTWDMDNSGNINRYELTVGMARMIKENNLPLSITQVYQIMDEVDLDSDKVLDRREFGCFLSRIASTANVSLDGVTSKLLRQREDEANKRLEKIKQSQNLDLTHEGWKMMPHLFDTWDVDNSGTIDKYELTSGMSKAIKSNGLEITIGEVCNIMQEVDLDSDRTLDRREFGCFLSRVAQHANVSFDGLAFMLMKQREVEARQRLERIKMENKSNEQAWLSMPRLFEMWDVDGDGHVSREEVAVSVNALIRRKEINKISLAECLRLMDEVDDNGDRVLNQMEFGAFMARLALASGVLMEKLVQFFMHDCEAQRGTGTMGGTNGNAGGYRRGSGPAGATAASRRSRFGSIFAKLRVSMAEEEIVEAPV